MKTSSLLPNKDKAYDFIVDGIAYKINPDGVSVTITYEKEPSNSQLFYPTPTYSNVSGSLVIPEYVTHSGHTYIVTAIGNNAFSGCSGFNGMLVLPNSVTKIGWSAFFACSGFTGSLTIPDSVTEIASYAFAGCLGFTGALNIPNSVTSIGENAFLGCSGFYGSLIIPNSVIRIGRHAFSGCSGFTGSLIIPKSLTDIGGSAFGNCLGIETLIVVSDNPKYDSRDNCNAIIETETNTMIGGIKNFTIPNSVTAIGDYAFDNCRGFTGSLTIPNSVLTIGDYAFAFCTGFTGLLTIGNSVTKIGDNAFSDCSGFTGSLTIPNSVTAIGEYAFSDCSGFTGTLNIPDSVTSIGDYAFYRCFRIMDISIPSHIMDIHRYAFGGTGWEHAQPNGVVYLGNVAYCYKGTVPKGATLTLRDGIIGIAGGAFSHCSGFTGSLTIPNSVIEIGDYAFAFCTGFTGLLTIGNSVTKIGDHAFSDCSGFTKLNWNAKYCKSMGDLPKSQIERVTIGNQVELIPDMFMKGAKITGTLIIPNSVTQIGNFAFADCSGLEDIILFNSKAFICMTPFWFCTGLHTLTLTGNGSWEDWPLIGIEKSQIKTLNVGCSITKLGEFRIAPEVVNSYAQIPPTCTENTFTNNEAKLHVPSSSTVAYFTDSTWQNFGNLANDINEKITLDKAEATLTVSEELQLKAVAFPSNMTNEIWWCSTNPAVAKVDDNGLVTAVSQGKCDIFVFLSSIPAVYASCHIGSYIGIILDINKANITPNQIITLTPKYDSKVTNIKVTSSNTAVVIARVVTIDGMKKVQVVGIAKGTATITVIDDGEIYRPAICMVTVT